jgi:riboflavin synthase
MFSGIIEEAATVTALRRDKGNLHITLTCSFVHELKIDQSVSHNGVCLTVVAKEGDEYTVTAIQETLDRSNLGQLQEGDLVNVERSLLLTDRLDGHLVQGHVDQTAVCTKSSKQTAAGVTRLNIRFNQKWPGKAMLPSKSSVAVNGVSLTVCRSEDNRFEVAIILYL